MVFFLLERFLRPQTILISCEMDHPLMNLVIVKKRRMLLTYHKIELLKTINIRDY